MRIALIGDFDTFAVRGLERPRQLLPYHLEPGLNLLRGLKEIGADDVHIVIVTPEVKQPTVENGPLGTVHRLPRPPLSGSASLFLGRRHTLLKELKTIRPDIVHGQGTEEAYAFTAVTAPYPHVVTIHGIMHRVHQVVPPPFFSLSHVPRWMEKIVVRRAREVVCISPAVQQFLLERGSTARCHLIPNAVTPCFFEVQRNPHAEVAAALLFVGTIYPLKGLLDLIEALPVVRRKVGGPVRLKVIGSPGAGHRNQAYYQRLQTRAQELDVAPCLEFAGVQSALGVATALSESDVLVLPSFQESAPMCITEAMAAGVPVVATRVGGVPSIVEHNVTGLLVNPGRSDELADAIMAILADVETRNRLGQAGRAKALACYTPRVVAGKTLAVYENILQEKS